jgi:transcriptional regulator with XRE-family HTH domain
MGNVINTRWFRDKLEDRNLSQRKLAKEIGIDPSAVSLMLRGLREISIEEAIQMAKILGLPKDEVLAQIGVDLSQDRGGAQLDVVGWIGKDGQVHMGRPLGPQKVIAPPNVPEGTVALRDQSESPWDGWVSYFKPVDYVMPEAIGRLSVVEFAVTGEKFVRIIKHGYEPGTFRLLGVNGAQSEAGQIVSASPILWIKQ